jgi:acyl-CoA dehydrogenase
MKNPFDTPERVAFRDSFTRFVADEITPFVDEWDEAGSVPQELHEKVGAFGCWGLGIPEEHGGTGFDDVFIRAEFSRILNGCGASGIAAAVGGRSISIGPLSRFASDEFRTTTLPEIIAGRAHSSLAITEPGGGSDVANMQTKAEPDGNGWRLNGAKAFITGGMEAEWFVVGARTAPGGLRGISLFLVPADAPGFDRAPLAKKQGWWASSQASLYFEDCKLPAEALIGPENAGFIAIMENFNYERLGMIAGVLGMMETCYAAALDWARERKTFGKRLIEHQVISHKFVEMSSRIDMTRAYLNHICWSIEQGHMPVAELSKAKASGTKALEYVVSECMQVIGGASYIRGNVVERAWREVKVMAIGGGSEEIMRDLAARQMKLADKQ